MALGLTERHLNGDQSEQGRALLMDRQEFRVYRVRLYRFPKAEPVPQEPGQ